MVCLGVCLTLQLQRVVLVVIGDVQTVQLALHLSTPLLAALHTVHPLLLLLSPHRTTPCHHNEQGRPTAHSTDQLG